MPHKKSHKKPPQRGDMSWMDRFSMPTQQQFQRYLQGQQGQFQPTVNTLREQLAVSRRTQDPTVKAYESLLGALPSSESVSGAYRSGLENVSKYMQDIDMARGGRGVSEAIGAIGGALGVEGAGDVAQTAGTVSGVGVAGGDVMSKAIMAGAAGQFAGLETERLGQLAEQRQGLTLGAGEARKSARGQRQELARMLAQARGQQRGAAPNPLDIANMIMQYQQNRRGMSGGYGRGTGGSTADGGTGSPPVGATEQEILAWMQSPTGGGYGVIGQGGLGSEGAARGQFRQQNPRPVRGVGSRNPNR